jgi:hypothetical protein
MYQGFSDAQFGCFATSLNFAHQHGSLDCSNAKVRELLLFRVVREAGLCFLPDEECGQLALHDRKDEVKVLSDQFIALLNLIAYRSKGTAPLHAKTLL